MRTGSDLKNPKRKEKLRQNTGEAEGTKRQGSHRVSIRTGPSPTQTELQTDKTVNLNLAHFFHPWRNITQLGAPCNRFLAWTHSLTAPRSSGMRPCTVAGCRPISVSGEDTRSKKAFFALTHPTKACLTSAS